MRKAALKIIISLAYFFEVAMVIHDILKENWYSITTKLVILIILLFVWIILYVFSMYVVNKICDS